jgi:hypothetical protein
MSTNLVLKALSECKQYASASVQTDYNQDVF